MVAESFVLRLIIWGLLGIIFALEITQMNLNRWADSWGAGCVLTAIS